MAFATLKLKLGLSTHQRTISNDADDGRTNQGKLEVGSFEKHSSDYFHKELAARRRERQLTIISGKYVTRASGVDGWKADTVCPASVGRGRSICDVNERASERASDIELEFPLWERERERREGVASEYECRLIFR